jgi:hypothetical protein
MFNRTKSIYLNDSLFGCQQRFFSPFMRLVWLASKLQFASQVRILVVWLSTGHNSSYHFSQVVTLPLISKEQKAP